MTTGAKTIEEMLSALYATQGQHDARMNMLERLSVRAQDTLEKVETTQADIRELLERHGGRLDQLEFRSVVSLSVTRKPGTQ